MTGRMLIAGARQSTALGTVALGLTCMLAAGPALAQEANELILDATYLAAPTDWCPADAGVPLVITMHGLDIIAGPPDWPNTVRERAGGNVRIIHRASNTNSFWQEENVDYSVIGRFSSEFQSCRGLWDYETRATGTWRLTGTDGSEIDAGAFEDVSIRDFNLPFFQYAAWSRRSVRYATFDDRRLFTTGPSEVTTTQKFLAESDKE